MIQRLKRYVGLLSVFVMVGCAPSSVAQQDRIDVISRESGSGTRDAFIEMTGLLVKTETGKTDTTTKEAVIQNSMAGIGSTVAGYPPAIGYLSLGTLTDKVKAVKVDGYEASAKEILAGNYPLQRSFTLMWGEVVSDQAQDFLNFVYSKEGQETVEKSGYIPSVLNAAPYVASEDRKGSISIVGSTSVAPLIEKLVEEYKKWHPFVQVDVTANGSSAGVAAIVEKTADIGMASRKLSEAEQEQMQFKTVALDGIVIVVNQENPLDNLTLEQVRSIFSGEITRWSDVLTQSTTR